MWSKLPGSDHPLEWQGQSTENLKFVRDTCREAKQFSEISSEAEDTVLQTILFEFSSAVTLEMSPNPSKLPWNGNKNIYMLGVLCRLNRRENWCHTYYIPSTKRWLRSDRYILSVIKSSWLNVLNIPPTPSSLLLSISSVAALLLPSIRLTYFKDILLFVFLTRRS